MASTATRVLIRGDQSNYEERAAVAALKPGHLVELVSSDKVQKHSTKGGRAERAWALEDGLRGWTRSEFDAYAADDPVPVHYAEPGDLIAARLPAGAPAVVKGDKLISNGDGCLIKATVTGPLLYASVAASTDVTNTVSTEQFFTGTYSLPAATLVAGDVIRIRGMAYVSAAAGTDTLTVKVYIGGIAVATTAALDGTTADVVFFDTEVTIRTVGASGTIVANFLTTIGPAASATTKAGILASSALDTTVTNVIRASATWSATTATCTVALQSMTVELIRSANHQIVAVAREAIDNSAGSDEALIIVAAM